MDAVSTIITVIFVAILFAVTVTFGAALLVFVLSVAVLTAVLIMIKEWWYRWRFVQRAAHNEKSGPKIIEGQYQDISKDAD